VANPEDDPIVIRAGAGDENRYSRFELISWWDQPRLAGARVLVVGAGALGNEIIKNLALVGLGRVLVADMDHVEMSNLSRSVLFRAGDRGEPKSQVAARAAVEINPDVRARGLVCNAVYSLGLGVYRWADVVICGLDNREARLHVNRAAWQAGVPWIDGAIERLQGTARVFLPPDGVCYECTMGAADWEMLERRRSCALLKREEIEGGKVPTTPTAASIIAGVQVQEALKLLHGEATMAGRGFVFDGQNYDSYMVTYQRKDDCLSHDSFENVESTGWSAAGTAVGEVLECARSALGAEAVLDLRIEIVRGLECPECGKSTEVFRSAGELTESDAICPDCSAPRRPEFMHSLDGSEGLEERTLADIGVPGFDVITARSGMQRVFWELSADASEVLGELVDEQECGS
jgi:sulfur-carrier protein adenylyltransferase/sulfurtransferase